MADVLKIVAALIAGLLTVIAVRGDTRDKESGKITRFGWYTCVLSMLSMVVALALISDERKKSDDARIASDDARTASDRERKKADERHASVVDSLKKQLLELERQTQNVESIANQSDAQLRNQTLQAERLRMVSSQISRDSISSLRIVKMAVVVEFDPVTKLSQDDFQGREGLRVGLDFFRSQSPFENFLELEIYPGFATSPMRCGEFRFNGFRLPLAHDIAAQRELSDNLVTHYGRGSQETIGDANHRLFPTGGGLRGPLFACEIRMDWLDLEIKALEHGSSVALARWPLQTIRDLAHAGVRITMDGRYADKARRLHFGLNDLLWLRVATPSSRLVRIPSVLDELESERERTYR